ncbi:hypothetical protein FACS1894105_12160 [Clostridia bacterium]|nr:hypothetical protein FACS1894105_12160 [Clostridia bacterium]
MPQIGLKYLLCAPLTEEDNEVSYTDGFVMSYAIKVGLSIEINEQKLHGDDRVIEIIREFKSGKLSLNGDHLEYSTLAIILGHTLSEDGKKLTAKGDDDGKYVGVGFYSTTIKNGDKKYRAIWLHKVKFGVPSENLETKGDSITFQTPTVEGSILTDIFGVWKEEGIFATEVLAKAWLNSRADIAEEG